MTEREQYQRFKAYMDAPCHELDERDRGHNDPHRLAFAEWGVPQEFLLWLWQAAEQASRREALEEAAKVCDELADGWNLTAQGATDGRYDFMAEAGDRCADEIRALSGPTET